MPPKTSAEQILEELAKIRASMPRELIPPSTKPRTEETRTGAQSMEEFEQEAIVDALETLAADARAIADAAQQRAHDRALEIYYAAEELARDPAHADLVPHVEAMRLAYERDYGKPIPPKS